MKGGLVYWYNPKTRSTESRPAPQTEVEAMNLLAGDPDSLAFWSEYDRLRYAGMGIEQALVHTGQEFRLRHLGHQPPN
jgi:hypothetical protein